MHSAQLVHITPDAEKLVAKLARVSNPSNENNDETAPRLIRYLIKNKHWSPMEMVSMCCEIKTTRSIAAQILRHRSFSYQEFSQRYSSVTEVPKAPKLRRQDTKNRQNSVDDLNQFTVQDFQLKASQLFEMSQHLYQEMLAAGVAKECAREVLPLATPTRLYMHGTLRSWLHYCDLRCGNGTQAEHKQIADSVKAIIFEQTPDIAKAMWGEAS
jgi:thymidylate synthase (FAD)